MTKATPKHWRPLDATIEAMRRAQRERLKAFKASLPKGAPARTLKGQAPVAIHPAAMLAWRTAGGRA